MKKIDVSTQIGDGGIALIHRQVNNMGFVWHERKTDAGIDGEIELRNPVTGEVVNRFILIQSVYERQREVGDAVRRDFVPADGQLYSWLPPQGTELAGRATGNLAPKTILSASGRQRQQDQALLAVQLLRAQRERAAAMAGGLGGQSREQRIELLGAPIQAAQRGDEVLGGAATSRIDAHHHFWDPARYSYPWMAGADMDPVRRAFTPEQLRTVLGEERIDGTVLVQTLSSPQETREFLDLAATTDFVHGVVGWVDLTSPSVSDDLDALLEHPGGRWLVGLRHQVHDEPDPDWLTRADVRRGLAAVQARGLAYDLLVRARELPAAVDAARDFPGLQFVLDHIAKPRIADGRDDPWSERLPRLAAQSNVAVKLSGMVTEADWGTWSPRDLRPFVSQVVEWFGVPRLMFGSDWPVCLLAGSYHAVLGGLIDALPPMTPAELDQVLGMNALRVYRLGNSSAGTS